MNKYQHIIISETPYFIQITPVFFNVPFLFREPIQGTTLLLVTMSPYILRLSLFWRPWLFWGMLVRGL